MLALVAVAHLGLGAENVPAQGLVVLGNMVQTYDGTAKSVSLRTIPPDLSVEINYDASPDAPTNSGSYTVSATITDPRYAGSAKGTLTISPAITNVVVPTNGIYGPGQSLDFVIQYSGGIMVSTNDGLPSLPLTICSTPREAVYVGGAETGVLTFRYFIQSGDLGSLAMGSEVALNGAVIQDSGGYDAMISFTPPGTADIRVDTIAPSISISDPSAAIAGTDAITYTLTYADVNFDASTLSLADIMLNQTGTAGASVSVAGDGLNRTITLSNFTGFGTMGISIAAGTARDLAGNLAVAAGPSATFIVDSAPTTLRLENTGTNGFRLSLTGAPGATYTIEVTDDLTNPNWQILGTTDTDAYGFASLHVSATNAVSQFFRASRPVDSGNGPGR
jgi:hypothetical protein